MNRDPLICLWLASIGAAFLMGHCTAHAQPPRLSVGDETFEDGLTLHHDGQIRVTILGSSSACGPFGQHISRELVAHGSMRPRRICHSSTGLARPDFFDWQDEVEGLFVVGVRVIVMLGGNDTQSLRTGPDRHGAWGMVRWRDEANWRQLYGSRLNRMLTSLYDRHNRVVVVLPSRAARVDHEERLVRVREVQRATVEGDTEMGYSIIDPSTAPLPARGAWLRDDVHLSRAGSAAAWEAIGSQLLAALGVP